MLIADVSEPSISSIFMPMKMELIEGSETSAISIVTPGNYPKENILHSTLIIEELKYYYYYYYYHHLLYAGYLYLYS